MVSGLVTSPCERSKMVSGEAKLTVKSDDVAGRAKTYEAIVKGDNMPTPSIPESFNVLVNELRGLGLEITFSK